MQEGIKEVRQKLERQIKMLADHNKELQTEVEKLSGELEKTAVQKRLIEDEMVDLKDRKDSVQQWESQVAEIIQW